MFKWGFRHRCWTIHGLRKLTMYFTYENGGYVPLEGLRNPSEEGKNLKNTTTMSNLGSGSSQKPNSLENTTGSQSGPYPVQTPGSESPSNIDGVLGERGSR